MQHRRLFARGRRSPPAPFEELLHRAIVVGGFASADSPVTPGRAYASD
jgi:hypothetical protein